jgi:uncharacterized delta-60 repeat protein
LKDIQENLKKLNTSHEQVTNLVPDLFYYSDEAMVSELGPTLVNTFSVQNDGKIVICGSGLTDDYKGAYSNSFFLESNSSVIRINSDGSIDKTFVGPSSQFNANFVTIDIQGDGKIIIGGDFAYEYNSKTYDNIIRLNTDGSIDETFNSGFSTLFNNSVNKVFALSDGILVTGDFIDYDGTVTYNLVKLNLDGTLDTDFNTKITLLAGNYDIENIDICPLSNGKIIFSYIDGGNKKIGRLNADGSEDESWSCNAVFTNSSIRIIEDSNNNIIASVDGTIVDGDTYYVIARFDSAGVIDDTLVYPEPQEELSLIALESQPDGKILIGGWIYDYGGELQRYIQRLNTDGSLDNTFSTPYSFDFIVTQITYLGNDEIGVGGYFGKPHKGFLKVDMSGNSITTGIPIENKMFGIKDGGNDLYDYGNFINTVTGDRTIGYDTIKEGGFVGDPINEEGSNFYSIPCTHTQSGNFFGEYDFTSPYGYAYKPDVFDGKVKSGSEYFGDNSQYFTQMYPGMFVLIAKNISIREFSITGGTGSYFEYPIKQGTVAVDVFSLMVNGNEYTCFLKSVSGVPTEDPYDDPSINQIIMVPGNSDGITHLYDETSQYDDHCVQGLTDRTEIYYIMVSRGNNLALETVDAKKIAQQFLNLVAETQPVKSCSGSGCTTQTGKGKVCILNNGCTCSKWRFFYPNCTRANVVAGLCSGKSGAYVPAITICNQRIF